MDTVCEAGLPKPNVTQACADCSSGGGASATVAIAVGVAAGALLAIVIAVATWLLLRRRARRQQVAPTAAGAAAAAAGKAGGGKAAEAAAASGAKSSANSVTAGADATAAAVAGSAFSCPALGNRYQLVDPATGAPLDPTAAELAAAAAVSAPVLPPVVVHLPDHRLRGEDTGTPTGRRSLRQRSPTRAARSHLARQASGAPPEHRLYIADSRDGTPRHSSSD